MERQRIMNALVVDDSRATRAILRRMMTDLGYEVVEAGDGVEALGVLKSGQPFDVALFDWNMPVMNGYDLLTAVRGDEGYRDMKIMMVTTETEMEQMGKALGAGANEYVMKPFTKDVISDKLALLGLAA
jgi:two-component system chemotaxis response regulator CheY